MARPAGTRTDELEALPEKAGQARADQRQAEAEAAAAEGEVETLRDRISEAHGEGATKARVR